MPSDTGGTSVMYHSHGHNMNTMSGHDAGSTPSRQCSWSKPSFRRFRDKDQKEGAGIRQARKNKRYNQVRDDIDSRELRHIKRFLVHKEASDPMGLSDALAHRDGADYDTIIGAIRSTTYLSSCSQAQVDHIIKGIQLYRFHQGDVVCNQGESAHYFFIVRTGQFQVQVRVSTNKFSTSDAVEGVVFLPGQYFGDITLIQSVPRAMTVLCTSAEGELWGIDRKTYRELVKNMTEQDFGEHKVFLKGVPMLGDLSDAQLTKLTESIRIQSYEPDEVIIVEGDVGGEDLYIIKSGKARVTIRGNVVREMEKGEHFGERALLFDEPRSATIYALQSEESFISLILNRSILESVVGDLQHVLFRNIMEQAISQSLVFEKFSREQTDSLVQAVAIRDYPEKMNIFAATPNHDVRYIMVLEGKIRIRPRPLAAKSKKADSEVPYEPFWVLSPGENKTDVIYLERGQSYGDHYVRNQTTQWTHEVITQGPTKLALLTAQAFVACLGTDRYSIVMDSNEKREVMKRLYLFQFLRSAELEKLIEKFAVRNWELTDMIIRHGDKGDEFFIIKEGEVRFLTNTDVQIRSSGKGAFFGERALILDETRTASVQVISQTCQCWVIDRASFSVVLQGSMLQHLKERMEMQDSKIKFDELIVERNCGKGGYGLVQLVRTKTEKEKAGEKETDPIARQKASRYALKRINKKVIVDNNMIQHTVNEMEIMKNLDHPFIIRQLKTWTNDRFLYYLQELVTGGELTNKIELMWEDYGGSKKLLESTKFYMASLVIAIEYIHGQSVVYRDFKPENVLLDNHGYIKVIDFGCAKKMTTSRTFTVAGTPHYMAPDVIIGGGYSYPCDLWTLGIMFYDMIVGYLPMGLHKIGVGESDVDVEDAEESQMKVYQQVLQGKLEFPEHNENGKLNPRSMWELSDDELEANDISQYLYYRDADAQHLCSKLLTRMADMRIGCSYRGIKDVKNHAFFEDFDWDALLLRNLTPPYTSKEETYQADEWDEEEEDEAADDDVPPVDENTIYDWEMNYNAPYNYSWDKKFTKIGEEDQDNCNKDKGEKEANQ